MNADAVLPARVLREAAEWFACLADPTVNEVDRARWTRWVAAHPDHAEAWRRVKSVTGSMAPLAGAGSIARVALERKPQVERRRRLLRSLAALAATGGGALAATRLPWREWQQAVVSERAQYKTTAGTSRAHTLPDDGHVWLGSLSALDVEYSPHLRRLVLHAGDLLIETAPDGVQPARHFVVDTPHGRMRALGTRFSVRADGDATRVDVFEGAIELTPRHADAGRRLVNAGERAAFDGEGVRAVGAAQSFRSTWAKGILLAEGMRLDELVAELARWHAQPITCSTGAASIRVVGVFPLRDLERVLGTLQASLPIAVRRSSQGTFIARLPG